STKPLPPEGEKSNPSKRHRERLNQELNKLTGLLPFPEDVCTRLDKLSILRLTVGYLKVKSYLMAVGTDVGNRVWDQPRAPGGNGHLQVTREPFPEGDLLLQALNGFIITVTGDGYIFYVSPTVQNYLGFHQSDLIHQSIYELVHADDRATFHCQLHDASLQGGVFHFPLAFPAIPDGCGAAGSPQHRCPEHPGFMERRFTCHLRCLLDNSSGFVALNFHGHLKLLLGQQKTAAGALQGPPPLALFAIVTPLQPFSILELQPKTLLFQSKHKLDFTPTACDARGTAILGYTEAELCRKGSGYQLVHVADVMHCAESHVRIMKTGVSGLTVFRLLTKNGDWVWLQANAWLVYKRGEPDCIISWQRTLTNEEGQEYLWKRNPQLPFSFATGEAVVYENNCSSFPDAFQAEEEFQTKTDSHTERHGIDPNSLPGAMMKQDASMYSSHTDVPEFTLPNVGADPDGPSQDEKAGHAKEDSSSLLVVIETLFEKSEVDGDISQTLQSLRVDNAELQWWEDTLLSLIAEEPPSGDVGERLGSELPSCLEPMLVREGAGKSMDFPCCGEEGSSAAQFQHCWPMNSAAPLSFQAPQQPQAASAQSQDAAVSLASVMSEGSSAQPEQQVLFDPDSLVGGSLLDASGSSSKPSAAYQLANPGQVFQAGLPTSVPIVSDGQSQPGCTPMGSSCPPPLDSNALVTQWHGIPVQTNLANALGQDPSPEACPLDAWVAPLKQLETAGAPLESQTLLDDSS
ncbi:AHR protein, partial [Alectura lathami]|nr:AHR protein [Alectura lathami]